MAPYNRLKTYSRGNNSTISCVDALNILFAKNITARKLNGKIRKKNNVQVKDLPQKVKSVFSDETSLHVNINDTFDRLLKGSNSNKPKNKNNGLSVKIFTNNLSASVIKHQSTTNASPMITKLRSFASKSKEQSTNNDHHSTYSWFKNPTLSGERVTNDLEIEFVRNNRKMTRKKSVKNHSSRESPIVLRSKSRNPDIIVTNSNTPNKSQHKQNETSLYNNSLSFNPIFTNSARERMLVHSSTPLIPNKRKQPLVQQPISPIRNIDDEIKSCIAESIDEIRKWNTSLNIHCNGIEQRSTANQDEYKQINKRKSFITLRTRITNKTKNCKKLQYFEKTSGKSGLFGLEEFELFHSKFLGNERGSFGSISVKGFEDFHSKYMSTFYKQNDLSKGDKLNFITNRRKRVSVVPAHTPNSLSTKLLSLENKVSLSVVLDKYIVKDRVSEINTDKEIDLIKAHNQPRRPTRLSLKLQNEQNLNDVKACRKFGAHSMPARIVNGRNDSVNNTSKSIIYSNHYNVRQLVCNVTKMNSSVHIEEINEPNRLDTSPSPKSKSNKDNTDPSPNESTEKNTSERTSIHVFIPKHGTVTEEESALETVQERSPSRLSNQIVPKTPCICDLSDGFIQKESGNEHIKIRELVIDLTLNDFTDTTDDSDSSTSTELVPVNNLNEHFNQNNNKNLFNNIIEVIDLTIDDFTELTGNNVNNSSTESKNTSPNNLCEKSQQNKPENIPIDFSLVVNLTQNNFKEVAQNNSSISAGRTSARLSLLPSDDEDNSKNILSEEPSLLTQNTVSTVRTSSRVPSDKDKNKSALLDLMQSSLIIPQNYNKSDASDLLEPSLITPHKDMSMAVDWTQNNFTERISAHEDKNKSDLSDLIESSLTTPQKEVFLCPKLPFKKRISRNYHLKTGKSWRRSLLECRKESVIDLTDSLAAPVKVFTISNPIVPFSVTSPRQSIRIVPATTTVSSRRKTTLQSYAQINLSTIIDESFHEIIGIPSPVKPKLSLPVITAKQIVLERCKQIEPLSFARQYPNSLLNDCKKIGEGVYGEVFLYRNDDERITVMKVIPIEGSKIINGERQKKFHEILSEVIIASELSNLRSADRNQTPGFCEVQSISCVKGKYPERLLNLWHEYDNLKGSENDPPEVFDDTQLYIVLSLAHSGQDLESYVFNNALCAVSMFKQVAYSLAIAERSLKFEHRDLHWGNVLLRSVDKNKKIDYRHNGQEISMVTNGVEATIIDFTLSRIEHEGVVIFNDLGLDPDLFEAAGDYQFDIYRLMQKKNRNNWEQFEPFTNILWLHYIVKKAIKDLRYKNTKTKVHKKGLRELEQIEEDLLGFYSASDFVSSFC